MQDSQTPTKSAAHLPLPASPKTPETPFGAYADASDTTSFRTRRFQDPNYLCAPPLANLFSHTPGPSEGAATVEIPPVSSIVTEADAQSSNLTLTTMAPMETSSEAHNGQ